MYKKMQREITTFLALDNLFYIHEILVHSNIETCAHGHFSCQDDWKSMNKFKATCPDCKLEFIASHIEDPGQCQKCGNDTIVEKKFKKRWSYGCDCYAEEVLDAKFHFDLMDMVLSDSTQAQMSMRFK
jgi:predicted Zn-ribbon and HTH transcriptional regulator